MGFVNYHAHSEWSLLDGAGSVKQRAEQAAELGQKALGITDHGNICGAPHHIKACNEVGITPVVGMEAYFKPDRFKQDKENKKAWHLLLLAKNKEGFQNLIKLQSESHTTGFYNRPCIDWELLKKHNSGIICSSACISGYLPWLIQENDTRGVDECIQRHLDIFGDDYRLEIMPHDIPAQALVNLSVAELSLSHNIPVIATGDSHYPYESWRETQDVLLMIATGQSRKKREKQREAGEDVYEVDVPLHMFSESEMFELFARNHQSLTKQFVMESMEETVRLVERIEEFEPTKSSKIPNISKGIDPEKILRDWCEEGLKEIGEENNPVYLDRLDHELKVLKDSEVIDYFVLVGKSVRWAREQGIRISSGRGSAAGSLVCYLTKITRLDPIAHDLLFERFLNPNRKGLPDIDLDFDPTRKGEVIEYIKKQVGEEHVASIGAFGTYHPKGAIKDVCRVLDVSFGIANKVTSYIPEAADVGGAGNVPPLSVLREQNDVIASFAKEYPEVWTHATRIEGSIKQLSKHAAGIIVTDKPVTEYIPLMKGKSDIVTGWTDAASDPVISELGLLKIDILSLDSLTKQGMTIKFIEENLGEKIDLDTLPIARDPDAADPKVLEVFQHGLTLGIFQFGGSRNIINFQKHVKPDRFEDLIAINALYRPGPLDGGDAFKYGDIKKGKIPEEYWHESVKPFLSKTYGVMAYQEQLQQIAEALGNFTPAEADDMRKATSKIYRMGDAAAKEFMSAYKGTWDQGCKDNGLTQEEADYVWERMVSFGAYSFNRSHSASYSFEAYKDAYLKTYYKEPFYASLLSIEEQKKAETIVREARQFDLEILPPDINRSDIDFIVEDKAILYGLLKIKHVGEVTAKDILENRPYSSYKDFCKKTTKCNKTAKEFLHKAGAFDSFGLRDDFSIEEKRDAEIEALGVAISGIGSSNEYEELLDRRCNTEQEFADMLEGDAITIGGEVAHVKPHIIKNGPNKGKPMGWVDVAHKMDSFTAVIFSKEWDKYKDIVREGEVILISGRKDDREQIIAKQIITAEKLKEALDV